MRRAVWPIVVVAVLTAGGCASDPIAAWRRSLEAYVTNHGNGDPGVLRNVDRGPSESDFSLIGARRQGVGFFFPRRTDANGELIGYERFLDRDWYVFLVGAVRYRGSMVDFPLEDPEVTDIRLVAFSGTGGGPAWLVGEPDEDARRAYCRPQLELWRRSHPDRRDAAEAPSIFPTPADIFRLTVTGEAVRADDDHSGAAWTLPLEGATGGPPGD